MRRQRSLTEILTALVTFVVVGGATVFILSQLQPHLLVANTTPSGGDMGAHVWGPAYLRDHLLHHGRISGWTPDWYGGFPWLTFYFPLPSLLIVGLGTLLPYGVAFKLVTVLGLLTLPVAAWAFGRLSGMPSPSPTYLAIATVPFVFDRTFTIYGGNIPSTLAGEFAFSISLSLMLVFLGVFARGLRTGRHRALAAALLAAVAVCHVVPVFFALPGALILTASYWDRARAKWALSVLAVGGLVAAFWVVPFVLRIAYTNDMGWEKLGVCANGAKDCKGYLKILLPSSGLWVMWLALAGGVVSVALRRMTGTFLAVMAMLSALAFRFAPQGRLWNARLLPFWVLSTYLLAGVAIAELGRLASWLVSINKEEKKAPSPPELVLPAFALVATLVVVALPLGFLGSKSPVTIRNCGANDNNISCRSFIPDWATWNYTGYERKAAYPEYHDLITTMTAIGKNEGCGRAMWEYEPQLDRLGTPMALMLLPYWTKGCIGSMEGLFFESSATTPYHFLNQSELSKVPSSAQRDLPYRSLDISAGIAHLKLLGVRYYMALSDEAKTQADADPDLRQISTSGPWSVTYDSAVKQRTWNIYEVAGSDVVAPLDYEPVVMSGVAKGGKQWLQAATAWYQDSNRWDVPLAAGGPKQWQRVRGDLSDTPRRAVDPAIVSNIKTGDDFISFDVDHVGSPVLVKASYFPNWQARGAGQVWRVTPNQMVVIPTSRHVRLHYGWTPVDGLAWGLTLLGLVGLVVMWRLGPVAVPEPTTSDEESQLDLERELAEMLVESRATAGLPAGADGGADDTG